ncbi:dTMP kinase [Kovacikia minuta CCNUW1]|uniref:dTMP kinase n=1 Tax=Kovacikia minuta TaxID=2931930 RepID=UPI001CCCE112|nr:dTMP kinase [Kovacikia minuta]UBF25735.1 dTMP kinase [Kovacikia minuta CCNUW1]
MRGRLIVFEGVEGCGKTTQLEKLRQWFVESGWFAKLLAQGQLQQLITTREPGGTLLGLAIRQLLMGQTGQEPIQDRAELLLFAADRAQHVEGFLRPHLEQGAMILCDRYTDSTVAYQGYGRGLNLSLIAQLNQLATQGLESDLTLWLDLDVEIGLARSRRRGTLDRIEQSDLAFHQRVQQGFATLAHTYPNRIVRIDASAAEQKVADQIQIVLQQRLADWYRV